MKWSRGAGVKGGMGRIGGIGIAFCGLALIAAAGADVLEDYRKAFGEDPPMLSGIAIMTDTDNTGESATAYYGDIRFRRGSQ